MALLYGTELEKVVDLFEKRGVFFYHACQLKDFKSYVTIGGIPSRYLLEKSNSSFTAFETDQVDHHSGVWPKVFGNLTDFGQGFAIGNWRSAPTPNPYGPILLVAKPSILLKSTDVAICLRSAGGRDFNREAESLRTADEVDQIFKYKIDEPLNQQSKSYLKYSDELRREFHHKYSNDQHISTYNPEISCTVQGDYLPFTDLDFIVTDKYWVNNNRLINVVKGIVFNSGLMKEIRERRYRNNREQILTDLVNKFTAGPCSLQSLSDMRDISSITKDWANRLISNNLKWQYKRFAAYLEEGTLSEMRKLPSIPW